VGSVRFAILSDLHIDLNDPSVPVTENRVLRGLLRGVERQQPDVLVIAGDVSNHYRTTLEALEHIQSIVGLPCLFAPGNHDLWREQPDADLGLPAQAGATTARPPAWQSYEALQVFPGNLSRGPLELPGGWLAIGDTGWYDYTFGDHRYSLEDFDRMELDGRLWMDKVLAIWDRPTRDMHRWFLERLERRLSGNRGRRILLVTHAVSHPRFTVRPADRQWAYLNAFLGSPQYGELAVRSGAELAVCGHVHFRRQFAEGPTRFVCNCLGYATEWGANPDPARESEQALLTLEL
jgi:Icc-related predicted phosphoesterase